MSVFLLRFLLLILPSLLPHVSSINCISITSLKSATSAGSNTEGLSCPTPYSLLSCGFRTDDITENDNKGGYINPNNGLCHARNGMSSTGVYAIARCCDLSEYAASCQTYQSPPNDNTIAHSKTYLQCPISTQSLFGCTSRTKAGRHNGNYPKSGDPVWNPTTYSNPDTCAAWSFEDGVLWSFPTCCSSNNGAIFNCQSIWSGGTAAQYAIVSCPNTDQFMAGCSGASEDRDVNQWEIDSNNRCIARNAKPNTGTRIVAIAICCSVATELNPTISPTANTAGPTSITASPTAVTTSPTANTPSPTSITVSPTSNTVSPTSNTPSPTRITINPIPARTSNPTPTPISNTASPTINTPSPSTITTNPTPTATATSNPTSSPTSVSIAVSPILNTSPPTRANTINPTGAPTSNPTSVPISSTPSPTTSGPTPSPTFNPTPSPTFNPTPSPTNTPTPSPTDSPFIIGEATGNPTLFTFNPTSTPTNIPTSIPINIDMLSISNKTQCGRQTTKIKRWCYDIDIYPLIGIETSETVIITNIDDSVDTYFNINIKPNIHHCTEPAVTFIFEEIDFYGTREYLQLLRNDGTQLMNCTGSSDKKCGHWITCINNIKLEDVTQINKDEIYTLTVYEPKSIDDLCTDFHPYSIHAIVTITCSAKSASPTPSPTKRPTMEPTFDPTYYPTLEPTFKPTIYPTEYTGNPTDFTHSPSKDPLFDNTANGSDVVKMKGITIILGYNVIWFFILFVAPCCCMVCILILCMCYCGKRKQTHIHTKDALSKSISFGTDLKEMDAESERVNDKESVNEKNNKYINKQRILYQYYMNDKESDMDNTKYIDKEIDRYYKNDNKENDKLYVNVDVDVDVDIDKESDKYCMNESDEDDMKANELKREITPNGANHNKMETMINMVDLVNHHSNDNKKYKLKNDEYTENVHYKHAIHEESPQKYDGSMVVKNDSDLLNDLVAAGSIPFIPYTTAILGDASDKYQTSDNTSDTSDTSETSDSDQESPKPNDIYMEKLKGSDYKSSHKSSHRSSYNPSQHSKSDRV